MKRRRNIGPKTRKNRSALIKFLALAVVVALVGSALAYLTHRLSRAAADVEQESPSWAVGLLSHVSTILILVTLVATVGLIFFGVRAFLTGSKARHNLQASRMKLKK